MKSRRGQKDSIKGRVCSWLSFILVSVGKMTDAGGINTCFLTTRMPLWAGVRQNVVGSNIDGVPVLSGVYNGSSSSTATARAGVAEASLEAVPARAAELEGGVAADLGVMEEMQLLKDAVVRAESNIAALTATIQSLQTTMDSIQASMSTAGETKE